MNGDYLLCSIAVRYQASLRGPVHRDQDANVQPCDHKGWCSKILVRVTRYMTWNEHTIFIVTVDPDSHLPSQHLEHALTQVKPQTRTVCMPLHVAENQSMQQDFLWVHLSSARPWKNPFLPLCKYSRSSTEYL